MNRHMTIGPYPMTRHRRCRHAQRDILYCPSEQQSISDTSTSHLHIEYMCRYRYQCMAHHGIHIVNLNFHRSMKLWPNPKLDFFTCGSPTGIAWPEQNSVVEPEKLLKELEDEFSVGVLHLCSIPMIERWVRHKFIPGTEKRGTWCPRFANGRIQWGVQSGRVSTRRRPKAGDFFLRLAMRSSAVKGNKSHLKRSEQVWFLGFLKKHNSVFCKMKNRRLTLPGILEICLG